MTHSPLLSVLVATMPSRAEMFSYISSKILLQITSIEPNVVEFLYDDTMGINIGQKRNRMIEKAKGLFLVFIDDDDDISENYVELIVNSIKLNPNVDAVGMRGKISFNGGGEKKWIISRECKKWYEENNVYYRTQNHISPVRSQIARKVGFSEKAHGEDFDYSMALIPHIKSEVFIDEELYHYKFVDKKR